MTRSVVRSVLMAGALAVLVAGCGTPEAGSAATLDGRRISVQDVQSATVDIQKLYGPDQPVPQRSVLFLLAAEPYIEQLAVRYNAGASDDDARNLFGTKVANPSSAALTVIRANTSLSKIDQLGGNETATVIGQVDADLKRDSFTVNPRYGTFNPATGALSESQPNWLPTPTPSATPTASQ